MTPYTIETIRWQCCRMATSCECSGFINRQIRHAKIRDEEGDYKGSLPQLFLVKTGSVVFHGYGICGAVLYRLYDNKTDHEIEVRTMRHKNSQWYRKNTVRFCASIVDDDGNCTCGRFRGHLSYLEEVW